MLLIRVTIQNYLHQNKNREEVKNREVRYLPDLSIFNLLSVFVLRGAQYGPTDAKGASNLVIDVRFYLLATSIIFHHHLDEF